MTYVNGRSTGGEDVETVDGLNRTHLGQDFGVN